MLSIWEKEVFGHYEYVIVGAGITGLSTAISVLELMPEAKVLILERGTLPSGASTKNAGFACFGSLTELLSDLRDMSEEEVLALVEMRWRGLQKLRKRLGDEPIQYLGQGGYELIEEKQLPALDRLAYTNALLKPMFGQNVYALADEKIDLFGFGDKVKVMVYNPLEGQLHPGLMIQALTRKAQAMGAVILTGTEVKEVGTNTLGTVGGWEFGYDKLLLCTNAFTEKLTGEKLAKPGRGIVVATKPLAEIPFRGTFHLEEGYYYFRDFGERVLLGGGRNLDFGTEETLDFGINETILRKLKQLLKEVILPGTPFEIEHTWSGIMSFGDQKVPVVKQITENTFAGYRLGGMGVAIGTEVGEQLARLSLSN